MKKYIFIVILLLGTLQLFSQEKPKKFDFRFGTGFSLLGTGDMQTINFENEFNFKFSRYFTTSASLVYGRSNSGVYESASFIQGNLNIFISPFRNNRKNDFRFGGGISGYNVSDSFTSEIYNNGTYYGQTTVSEKRNAFGFNIILEDSYIFPNNFLIGLKLFTQPYTNGDINSGVLLKIGVAF